MQHTAQLEAKRTKVLSDIWNSIDRAIEAQYNMTGTADCSEHCAVPGILLRSMISALVSAKLWPKRVFDKRSIVDLSDSMKAFSLVPPSLVKHDCQHRYGCVGKDRGRWPSVDLTVHFAGKGATDNVNKLVCAMDHDGRITGFTDSDVVQGEW